MNKTLNIINNNGEVIENIEIPDNKIELKKGNQAVYDAVRTFLASQHRSTASTKTRSNIRGGGCKPFRQKGLGRARAGTIRSPLWRHGAITFGPLPEKNYKKNINKKVLKLALKRAFSEKLNENSVLICDSINISSGKTKDATAFLKKINAGENVAIVSANLSEKTILALRNLPEVSIFLPQNLNTYNLLLHEKILFDKNAFNEFMNRI